MLASEQAQQVMAPEAWRVAAIGLWMAIWWATEAIPVFVTAFLPIVAFAPLGVASMQDATAPYANPTIFLFLGGFMMALAIEKWNLHRRIALAILDRIGTSGGQLIGGFMLVCALLSMWMTNTSTTMMLLPIVLSVSAVICDHAEGLSDCDRDNFKISMLLGLAYSASIGGLATLIGTPPNALLVGFMAENYGVQISFARWMVIGIPITLLMLPLAWLVLTKLLFPVDIPANDAVRRHLHMLREELGPMTAPERRVAIVFMAVVACWMLRRPLTEWLGLTGVSDAGIVMTAAILLFVLPSGENGNSRLMIWQDASRLPWGVLILFGGGLSLAAVVSSSGLALWLGESLAPLNALGIAVLVVAAVTLVIFLTELTSNLATTATLLPVVGAIALQAGVPPIVLTVPITIAASCAFMLPVATPPNAIVFSTGAISIPQMVRAGITLNIFGIIIVTIISLIAAPWLLL
ncbi:MAG: DASS family sodium-coupled anion symporter [Woeseiaceae bacterium]|nr:DASS family sodium-coupled anion symporter [Woeseiaceae bacterium]